MIKVTYQAVDGAKVSRSFKTAAGAREFAVGYVGKHPDIGRNYAVSSDGVGKITVSGISLPGLFEDPAAPDDE